MGVGDPVAAGGEAAAGLGERFDRGGVVAARGPVQWRAPQIVSRVDHRAEVEQDTDGRGLAGHGGEMERRAAEAVVGQLGDRAAGGDQFAADICDGRAGPEVGIAEVAADLPGVERRRFVRINRRGAASCERRCKQRQRRRDYQNKSVTPPPPIRTKVLTASIACSIRRMPPLTRVVMGGQARRRKRLRSSAHAATLAGG